MVGGAHVFAQSLRAGCPSGFNTCLVTLGLQGGVLPVGRQLGVDGAVVYSAKPQQPLGKSLPEESTQNTCHRQ